MNVSPALVLFLLNLNIENLIVFILFMVISSYESSKSVLNDGINAVLLYIFYKLIQRSNNKEITAVLSGIYMIQKYKKNNTFLDKYVSNYYKESKLKRDEMIENGLLIGILASSLNNKRMIGGGNRSLYDILMK